MHQPADPAVAGSLSLSARSGKSLQSLRASLAGSRSGHVSRHSLRAAEVGVYRWAEEAHGDDELLSMLLRASGRAGGRRNVSARRLALLAVGGRVCPRSGPLLLQVRRNWRFSVGMRAPRLGATTAYLFKAFF